MKAKILKRDFDAAVKQPWDPRKCVIAQVMIRMGVNPENPYEFAKVNDIRKFQIAFDLDFNQPGDENKTELKDLRASLPVSFELKETA